MKRLALSSAGFATLFCACWLIKLTYCRAWDNPKPFESLFEAIVLLAILGGFLWLAWTVWEFLIGKNVIGGYLDAGPVYARKEKQPVLMLPAPDRSLQRMGGPLVIEGEKVECSSN